ncbi:MAG: threonine synthase [Christensenellales bacterium]
MMSLISTRTASTASPFEAVLCGLAPDGGLYVPASLPAWTLDQIQALAGLPYEQAAARVLHGFFDAVPMEEMQNLTKQAYASFTDEKRVPVSEIEPGLYAMELYHGPTLAFKDVALQLLPLLMAYSAKAVGKKEKSLVLVATSGDTGKAALEGFADKADTAIVVCYPNDGVSPAQRLQMVTQKGDNVCVTAVEGNFDDCQNGVKRLMGDRAFHKMVEENGYTITSANSINFGRLVPQIVYYFTSYAELLRRGEIQLGELLDFVVPTGNFGDILAGWYAKKMGLPVGKLICASNKNNVLSRFFETGTYDCSGELYKTTSPSMDILISSNLERLLFELTEKDPEPIRTWMEQRAAQKRFTVEENLMEKAREDSMRPGRMTKRPAAPSAMCLQRIMCYWIRTALWGIVHINNTKKSKTAIIKPCCCVRPARTNLLPRYCPLWAIRQMGRNRPPKPWRRLPANRCRRPFWICLRQSKSISHCVAPEELDNLVKEFLQK